MDQLSIHYLCGSYQLRQPLFEMANGQITEVDDDFHGRTAEDPTGFGYLIEGSYDDNNWHRRLNAPIDEYRISNITSGCLNLDNDGNLLTQCNNELINYKTCCDERNGWCERSVVGDCKLCISYIYN